MMNKISHGLALLLTAFWVGGLLVVGYIVVPVVFQSLPDRQMAGMLAGKLFSAMAYAGMVCAACLLIYHFSQFGKQAVKQKIVWLIGVMLLLTLLGQFGIQPIMAELRVQALPAEVMQSALADRFRMLHGLASIIYLVLSLLGVVLVLKMSKSRP